MADEYGAYVTVRYWLPHLYSKEDVEGTTPEALVKWLIQEEGLLGLVEDNGEIINIEHYECCTDEMS